MLVGALQPFVQLHGALEQQEQAAGEQDQIAAGERLVENSEQRRGQGDQPGDAGQQHQAHDQRQDQANHPRPVALGGRQLVGEDGDEDQIVDAKDDLQHHQSRQTEPDRGISEPFHDGITLAIQSREGRRREIEQAIFRQAANARGRRRRKQEGGRQFGSARGDDTKEVQGLRTLHAGIRGTRPAL